jgi:hypothetical protein
MLVGFNQRCHRKECSNALEQSRRFMSQLSDAGKENSK